MTDNFCRCGLRLSVADTSGVCLACVAHPIPEPAVYTVAAPRSRVQRKPTEACARCHWQPRLPFLSYCRECRCQIQAESARNRRKVGA